MDSPKILALHDIQSRLDETMRILEVGFGDASFVKELCDMGFSVVGTEVSEGMVKKAQEKVPQASILLSGDPSDLPYDFAAVCCFEVFEHLEDPEAFARKLPGPLLYASVPNPWRWYPRLTGRYEYWDFPPNHLWRYCACNAAGPDDHEPGCKLGDEKQVAPSQRAMSLRWLLQQAGYTKITMQPTQVQAHDLLRIIPIRRVSGDYDDMRRRSKLGLLTSAGRRMLIPATMPAAAVLNLLGQSGVSYYIRASRG